MRLLRNNDFMFASKKFSEAEINFKDPILFAEIINNVIILFIVLIFMMKLWRKFK